MHKNGPESFVLSCVIAMIPSLRGLTSAQCSLCIKALVVSPKSYAGGFGTFFHRKIYWSRRFVLGRNNVEEKTSFHLK